MCGHAPSGRAFVLLFMRVAGVRVRAEQASCLRPYVRSIICVNALLYRYTRSIIYVRSIIYALLYMYALLRLYVLSITTICTLYYNYTYIAEREGTRGARLRGSCLRPEGERRHSTYIYTQLQWMNV
jgi:hypothetical protein